MYAVIINWVECERGMGQRPDGFSIHIDINESLKYVEEYLKKQPNKVPDEYEKPISLPTPVILSNEQIEILKDCGFPDIKSLRVYKHTDLFSKIKL